VKRILFIGIILTGVVCSSGAQTAGLFEDEELTEGERQSLEAQIQAGDTAIEALETLEMWFLAEQMRKGDCGPAIEIEGKAKSGDAESQWFLADLHRTGLCFKQSPEEAVRWLASASLQGHSRSQFELGLAYYHGTGVQKNYQQAVRYFRKAAEEGIGEAARALGSMYGAGEGVPQDRQEALFWFERAIELGNAGAASQAAATLLTDDPRRALNYSLPAANAGDERAQFATAYALANLPEGKAEDLIEAHKWANIASNASIDDIAEESRELRSQLEAEMKPSDITIAQQRASGWKPVPTGTNQLQTEAAAPTELAKLPAGDTSTADQLNSQEAKLHLKELGVPINRDAFFEAVKADNLGVFKLFHMAGADLESTWGSAQVTPLYVAADNGAQSVFDYLLAEGANVNAVDQVNGMTPLLRAIAWDNQYMIDQLLDAGATARQDPRFLFGEGGGFFGGSSPLLYAIMGDDLDLIHRLFKHGASVDERYAWKQTPLMWAAKESPNTFQVLIDYGADPNAIDEHGESVLHHILEQSPIGLYMLKIALEAGADPDPELGMSISPLLGATYVGNPGAVKLLLHYGAQVDRTYAVRSGDIPMVYSEEVRQIVMNQGTALMVAAQLGHASVAKLLIAYGADIGHRISIKGEELTASSIACNAGHNLVCNILK